MGNDIFKELAEEIEALPNKIEETYEQVTIQVMNDTADKMQRNLKSGVDKGTIFTQLKGKNAGIVEKLKNRLVKEKVYVKNVIYKITVDFDDTTIVDEEIGVNVGKYKNEPRAPKKRNYSIRPATWHDLAYIINEGRGENFSQTTEKVVAGNYFITKAERNARNWRKKRDKEFIKKIDSMEGLE